MVNYATSGHQHQPATPCTRYTIAAPPHCAVGATNATPQISTNRWKTKQQKQKKEQPNE